MSEKVAEIKGNKGTSEVKKEDSRGTAAELSSLLIGIATAGVVNLDTGGGYTVTGPNGETKHFENREEAIQEAARLAGN